MPQELTLAVVGVDHPNKRGPARRFAIDLCRPGEPVSLVPEPKNPVDETAVMVLNKEGMQMGYITAERCGWVKRQIESGAAVGAIFQASTTYGALIRVSFDGNPPSLPPEFIEDDPQDGFYPDWIPPDE